MKYTANINKGFASQSNKQGGDNLNRLYASNVMFNRIWIDYIAHFKSEITIASYESDLDEVMNYFEKDFLEIYREDVKKYYEMLQKKVEDGTIKASTLAKKFRELHSVARFICDNREHYGISNEFQDCYEEYLRFLAKQEKYTKSIPIEHMDQLLEAAQGDRMAYTILTLLYRVGLSSTEIISLKKEHFAMYDNGIYVTVEGRRNASYIPEDVFVIIEQYFLYREQEQKVDREISDYMFVNRRGNPLNLMYVSRMMKKYTEKAGIPSYSAESIRNTCGVNMFAYGATSQQVAAQMGVTQMQIHRYHNLTYKEHMLREANELVNVKVLPPRGKEKQS